VVEESVNVSVDLAVISFGLVTTAEQSGLIRVVCTTHAAGFFYDNQLAIVRESMAQLT
jgi:tyrosine-protein phosphatase YwqE